MNERFFRPDERRPSPKGLKLLLARIHLLTLVLLGPIIVWIVAGRYRRPYEPDADHDKS